MRDAGAEAVSREAARDFGAPTPPVARIAAIDIIRGFTIAGIVFANILWISGFLELSAAQRAPMMVGWGDGTLLFAIRVFIFGKFYFAFAFLFGVGFTLQLERAETRGQDFNAYFVRRMLVLFVIGCAHALLIWWGDILRFYALLGLALLVFRSLHGVRLIGAIALCLVLPVALEAGSLFLWSGAHPPNFATLRGTAELKFFQTASFQDWFLYNLRQIVDHAFQQIWEGRVFQILGMFLTGMWIARHGIFREPRSYRPLLLRGAIVGLTIGILGNLAKSALRYGDYGLSFEVEAMLTELLYLVAVPALCAGYLASLVLLCSSPAWSKRLGFLGYLGRISLTNYVSQNLICALLFRSYFLNLYGQLTLSALAFAAISIITMQVVFSRWWLAHFRFGPLEWLWRSLTYKQVQLLRRPAT